MMAAPNLDAAGRFLQTIAGYYDAAPVVWWTLVSLVALWICAWAYRGKEKK